MKTQNPFPLDGLDEDAALRAILEGTASETGEKFFAALVRSLAQALHTHGAWVTEYLPESRSLHTLALWLDGDWIENYDFDIAGTPCELVVKEARLVHIPDRLVEIFPRDVEAITRGLVSYLGVPLKELDGGLLGHLAVIDKRPMPERPRTLALFQIFASQAAAELKRLRAETQLREREEKLSRVMGNTMDAIIELDENFRVTLLNPAAEKTFNCSGSWATGQDFARFLSEESRERLQRLARELDCRSPGRQSVWIPGGLEAKQVGSGAFPAEATVACFEARRRKFYTLVLRNVNERLEAERKIQSLRAEAECLREEVRATHNWNEIVGKSEALTHALRDVQQVAATETTVLIQGETGTGKELFARAVHRASPRREKPLITVNCAAVPATLVESEFFGHEKGAFTGAMTRRAGRFALADGGTIFLDEVGELPLDLQAKLLRVLQGGEFEPVGSSKTRKVDVRVLAATNRDLLRHVKDGKFREDLFYRLNVFPITVPPLRERGDDVVLLAAAYAERFARRMGRQPPPLSPEAISRLKAYAWPGNVRELVNVIERAVITSQDGQLNLERALPEAAGTLAVPAPPAAKAAGHATGSVYTIQELESLERQNLLRALEAANGKVAGEKGAARLLGMNPSTLNSRLKALGIKRPRPALWMAAQLHLAAFLSCLAPALAAKC
jgi:PAS domain S-box-containing protein